MFFIQSFNRKFLSADIFITSPTIFKFFIANKILRFTSEMGFIVLISISFIIENCETIRLIAIKLIFEFLLIKFFSVFSNQKNIKTSLAYLHSLSFFNVQLFRIKSLIFMKTNRFFVTVATKKQ